MKTIKLIILILGITVILSSCNDNKNELKIANSINGDWTFRSPSSSGEFTVKDSVVTTGNFTVNSKTYSIMKPAKITKDIILLVGSGDNNLALSKPVINKELTTITCTSLEYDTDITPTIYSKETIIINKK